MQLGRQRVKAKGNWNWELRYHLPPADADFRMSITPENLLPAKKWKKNTKKSEIFCVSWLQNMFFSVDLHFLPPPAAIWRKYLLIVIILQSFKKNSIQSSFSVQNNQNLLELQRPSASFWPHEKDSRWSQHPSSERFTIPISVLKTKTQLSWSQSDRNTTSNVTKGMNVW